MKKRHFLKQFSAVVILAIFSLAITPWGALHHHESETIVHEKNCTHTVHVKTSAETCLICKAHFEKNFTADFQNYLIYLKSNPVKPVYPLVGNSFTEVIASCLRGPPSFS
ncbi:hypothetical protein [Pedobacter sp. SL55]|uniref:hypothetical protein n=1 Tax=Pedobacter sp. SL55 TaxID=2995161 RepID=UPI002270D10E|nr:hypothetical protein [Pedobacter sp. SL55]WAC41989.1 hypothetical protein OVA16_06420 [Pedobacter sp. SL55]